MLKELLKDLLKEELKGSKTKSCCAENTSMPMIGKVCVFRTYSAGVHVGTLASKDGKECLVKDSRRIWYWEGACSLSQIATEGSTQIDKCKIAVKIPEIWLTEVIEIIPMSEPAISCIFGAKEWKK
jgi:hypothetical protein